MNVRRYERGVLVAGYQPLELPASPWRREPVEVKPEPPRKRYHRTVKPTKYGIETLKVGQSMVIPFGTTDRLVHKNRITATATNRHRRWPERFTTHVLPDGVMVKRIA